MFFYIMTFGCKVNQYESREIEKNLANEGFEPSLPEMAQVIIVNSCMVTETSEQKVKSYIRKMKSRGKFVVLTGCMANCEIETAADLSIPDKSQIANILKEHFPALPKYIVTKSQKTRKFIKIQDGCNRFCSYCIIPYARNKIWSKPIDEIISEAKTAAEHGYKEIVLIGINLAAYDYNNLKLIDVIEKLPQNFRIRLGSLEPELIDENMLLRLTKIENFCPHFHLSLQSGSDKILTAMNRRYTGAEFESLVTAIRKYYPDAGISTDIIVGFPGETDNDFNETFNFAEKLKLTRIHVFPFSPRNGTVAYTMKNQIDENIKKERVKILTTLASQLADDFYSSQIGKVYPVLFEKQHQGGYFQGYTPNYILVKNFSDLDLKNKIINITIGE